MRIQLELKDGVSVRPQIDAEGYLYLTPTQAQGLRLNPQATRYESGAFDLGDYEFYEETDSELYGESPRWNIVGMGDSHFPTLSDMASRLTGRRCGGYLVCR